MKNLWLYLFLLVLVACNKNDDTHNPDTPNNPFGISTSPADKKCLTGTFIQLFGKGDWTQDQWNAFLAEIKALQMNTLIVQYTAYKNPHNDVVWFDSATHFTSQKIKHTLSRLLSAAERQGIEVHIGLLFDETYWQNQTNTAWLQTNAQRCIALAQEINAQFGKHSAFKGWYIPHEPEPYAYNTDPKIALFRDSFVNPIANAVHQWDDKPVSIATFFNSNLSSPAQLGYFMAELAKSNLQIIMLQDGVGAAHVSLERLAEYYQSAEKGLFQENTTYKGLFWTDLETFYAPTGNPPFTPASFDRVKQQLLTELAIPKVSKAVSFQYYDDMSTQSPHKPAADALKESYKSHFVK